MVGIIVPPKSHSLSMVAHRMAQRAASVHRFVEDRPPVILPATEVAAGAPFLNRTMRSVHKAATDGGHRARITKATGPWLDAGGTVAHPVTHTVCIAVQGQGGQRLVFHWRFLDSGKWVAEDAQDYRTGEIMTITKGQEVMASWPSSRTLW